MQPVKIAGMVKRALVGEGSKSERHAIVLDSADGKRYILRRHGGPAFADPELETLVGNRLVAEGLETGNTLIMHEWRQD